MIQFHLEKYHGTKSRLTCPGCGYKNVFARYINTETGEYLADDTGRCNRESKCGYHYTPKMFYEANPQLKTEYKANGGRTAATISKTVSTSFVEALNFNQPDYIDFSVLQRTLANYEGNAFVRFLLDLFPEDRNIVLSVIGKYFVGTTKTGKTIFWQIDEAKRIRTGKIILYDARTGKRVKSSAPGWVHAELKKQKQLSESFNLGQCFFGAHLLRENENKPVAITEAEKTAVIASICFPEFVWLAIGSKQSLKPEKLKTLRNRKIILYPDADGFGKWREIAQDAREVGLTVNVSDLIEKHASAEEKANGCDLADYLIGEQTRINSANSKIDEYNRRLDKVLSDQPLIDNFNDHYAKRLTLMRIGELPASEIRAIVRNITEGAC